LRTCVRSSGRLGTKRKLPTLVAILETFQPSSAALDNPGVSSQSLTSNFPPQSRQKMNSCSNRSNGPQSRPWVSVEVAMQNSPGDEPQLGHAADFHGNDHRFQLKAINDFILGDHHRSEATLAF